jgi:hypothetical protein
MTFTKDPKLENYIIVLKYASGGGLHNYLQRILQKLHDIIYFTANYIYGIYILNIL